MTVNFLTEKVIWSDAMRVDLSDFVRKIINEKGMKIQDVADRSNGRITRGYVSQVISRTSRNLTIDKLAALADGLGVPLREVLIAASGGEPSDDDEFRKSVLFYVYEKLKAVPEKNREFYDGVIQMLLDRLDNEDRRTG